MSKKKLKQKVKDALIWSQKYTKTDMVYLTKSGGWLSFGRGVTMAIGLALSVASANLLPKESFGVYKYVLSIVSVLTAFSLTSIPTTVIRSVARGFEGALKDGFFANLKWSILIFLGTLAGAIYYYVNGNNTLALGILIAGSLSPFVASGNLYDAYLQGQQDFQRKTLYEILFKLIPATLLIATFFITDDPVAVIAAHFIGQSGTALLLYTSSKRAYPPNQTSDPEFLSYSKHLSLMDMMSRVATQLDKILAFQFLGAAPLAIYSFAIAPISEMQAGKKIVRMLALPKLSSRSFEELQRSIPRKAAILFLYSASLIIIYIFFAPYLYSWLFPQYIDSVFYSQLYALTLFNAPGSLFLSTLVAHQKKKELYIINVSASSLLLVLYIILLPAYGLTGLIIAQVVSKAPGIFMSYYFIKKPIAN